MSCVEDKYAKVECRFIPERFEVEYVIRIGHKLTVSYDAAIEYEEHFAHSIVNKLKNYVNNMTEVEVLNSIKEQHDFIVQDFESYMALWRN